MTITNIYLSPAEYDVLTALPALKLRKRRYECTHDDRVFTIDAFDGVLTGLMLSETGFSASAEMDQPLGLPSWVASEVTNDRRFTGGELVRLTPDEAADLIREIAPPSE
jgi:CYTH domain-containing protein